MITLTNRWTILVIVVAGTFIGIFRGAEARQKYVFKVRNRLEERRQLAEEKKLLQAGGVALDHIELAAFHQ